MGLCQKFFLTPSPLRGTPSINRGRAELPYIIWFVKLREGFIFNFQFSIFNCMNYFMIGMFSTLSLNSVLSQMADHFFAGIVSIVGGVISSIVVARVKRRWRRRQE